NITDAIAFKKIVGYKVYNKIQVIRKAGNLALHDNKQISEDKALQICKEAFHVMYWLYRTYTTDDEPKPEIEFDPNKVPNVKSDNVVASEKLEKLQKQNEERAKELRDLQQSLKDKDDEL